MRRCAALAVALALAAPGAAGADGPSWSRAAAAAVEPWDVYYPYLLHSPDRSRILLVENGLVKEIRLHERRKDGSWERIVAPGFSDDEVPSYIDVNDRGTMAFGWTSDDPAPPGGTNYNYCYCRAQGVVRRRDGTFGPLRTFTPAGPDQEPAVVVVNPDDTTTALWYRDRVLHTADATPAGEFERGHVIARRVDDWRLARAGHDRVFLEWLLGQRWYGATHPFDRPRPISNPGYGYVGDDVTIAGDRNGHEARVAFDDGDITIAYRRVGRSFGRPTVVAHAGPSYTACSTNAVMNAHRRVFATWVCDRDPSVHDAYAQGAIIGRDGRVASLSGRRPALPDGEYPGLDFDDHGRGVATWMAPGWRDFWSLVVMGGRVAGFRHVGQTDDQLAVYPDATIDRQGRGLATWPEDDDSGWTEFRVASIDLRE
jgi:hypothetical protein